jgi:hypothetical protein
LADEILTQVVDFSGDPAFPIVADPTNAAGDRITIQPTLAGGTFPSATVATYGWIELIEATPRVNKATYNQRFDVALALAGQTWDLEGWRTPSGPWGALASPCNW